MTRTSSLEVSIKTYIDCVLYIDCSICFIIVHMVAFVNLISKKMMMMMMTCIKYDNYFAFFKPKITTNHGHRLVTGSWVTFSGSFPALLINYRHFTRYDSSSCDKMLECSAT